MGEEWGRYSGDVGEILVRYGRDMARYGRMVSPGMEPKSEQPSRRQRWGSTGSECLYGLGHFGLSGLNKLGRSPKTGAGGGGRPGRLRPSAGRVIGGWSSWVG